MISGNLRRDRGGQVDGPRSRGERTRQTILARALKIAAREGLAAITIGRLAKELRMSKSGLFAHFGSKRALELATLEMARKRFFGCGLTARSGQRRRHRAAVELVRFVAAPYRTARLSGAYFFTGVFLEYVEQPGPIAEVVTRVAQEWFNALQKAVEEAQEKGEIDPKADSKQLACELNGLMLGAHSAYLLKHGDCWREARHALLSHLRKLATGKIPTTVFTSERNWKKYLQGKSWSAS